MCCNIRYRYEHMGDSRRAGPALESCPIPNRKSSQGTAYFNISRRISALKAFSGPYFQFYLAEGGRAPWIIFMLHYNQPVCYAHTAPSSGFTFFNRTLISYQNTAITKSCFHPEPSVKILFFTSRTKTFF